MNQTTELSFADSNPAALEIWAANLPLANTTATAEQLHMASKEIALLSCEAKLRYDLLESLRPLIHYACSRLSRGRPASADIAAHWLTRTLCQGYEGIFEQVRAQADSAKDARDLLVRSGHRLLSELGRLALHSYQKYEFLPTNYWTLNHTTFLVLENLESQWFSMKETDDSTVELSIEAVFLRNLLFAASNPNQLSGDQLNHVFNGLELWAGEASLDENTADAVLLVDLGGTTGPVYTQQMRNGYEVRTLRTDILTYKLEAFLNEVSTNLPVPDYISSKLLRHLIQVWSTSQTRRYGRVKGKSRVRLCVGLRAVHYFLSGGMDFNDQLANADAALRREVNPFLDVDFEPITTTPATPDEDPWSHAPDVGGRIPENPNIENPEAILSQHEPVQLQTQIERKYNHFDLMAVDTSPGGYRVRWEESAPAGLKIGELVALREESDNRWTVALIRWISGGGKHGEMGLELLAPRAIPVAIRQIQKKGSSAGYSRGLLLPELQALGQKASLVTPRMSFDQGRKISIQRQGLHSTGLLIEPVLNTDSVNQFTFRMLDGYLENPGTRRNIDALSAMTREDSTQGP